MDFKDTFYNYQINNTYDSISNISSNYDYSIRGKFNYFDRSKSIRLRKNPKYWNG